MKKQAAQKIMAAALEDVAQAKNWDSYYTDVGFYEFGVFVKDPNGFETSIRHTDWGTFGEYEAKVQKAEEAIKNYKEILKSEIDLIKTFKQHEVDRSTALAKAKAASDARQDIILGDKAAAGLHETKAEKARLSVISVTPQLEKAVEALTVAKQASGDAASVKTSAAHDHEAERRGASRATRPPAQGVRRNSA